MYKKFFSPVILTQKGDKNTSDGLEHWNYSYTLKKWRLVETFYSDKEKDELRRTVEIENSRMVYVAYYVEPGEERPSDIEYPFEVGEFVYLPATGMNTFMQIKVKEKNGMCACRFADGDSNYLMSYHCYKFQYAQEAISDKIQALEEEKEKYVKLSEKYSVIQNFNAAGIDPR
jgi:hypothetical protein